jgi:hypothetical protein
MANSLVISRNKLWQMVVFIFDLEINMLVNTD